MREGMAILLLLAIALAMGAFAEQSGITAEPVMTLSGSRWSLLRAELPAAARSYGARTTLEFSAAHVSVLSACTKGKASYRVVDGTLLLGDIRTTGRACTSGQSFYNALLAALGARPALKQTSTDLVLDSASGKLVFRAEPGPSVHAVSKVIYVAALPQSMHGQCARDVSSDSSEGDRPLGIVLRRNRRLHAAARRRIPPAYSGRSGTESTDGRAVDARISRCHFIREGRRSPIMVARLQDALIAGILKAWRFKLTSAMFPRKSATN
jgi:heat shock protein HslJ